MKKHKMSFMFVGEDNIKKKSLEILVKA